MAWTTPDTAVAGSTALTAAFWNANVRDNLNNLRALANLKSTTLTTTTTTTVTTGGTYYDISGLTVSITPTAATSKIMIWAQVNVGTGSDNSIILRLVRDSTAIGIGTSPGSRVPASTGGFYGTDTMANAYSNFPIPMQFLDSPVTTSAITYKIQVSSNAGAKVIYINRSSNDENSVNSFRAVSTITVMEIPA